MPTSSSDAESSRHAQIRQERRQGDRQSDPEMRAQIAKQDVGTRGTVSPKDIDRLIYGYPSDPATTASGNSASDRPRSDSRGPEAGWSTRKKRKITRARNACLPCRTRKCRCAGQPPDPCGSCIKDELKCSWPTEDGRSAEARQSRAQGKRKASIDHVREQTSSEVAQDQDIWSGLLGHDWLTDLGSVPGDGYEPQPSNVYSTLGYNSFNIPQANHLDSTFNSSLNVNNTQIPSPDWLSAFDPAQVVMALSSRLPLVEETSVHEEMAPPVIPYTGSSALRSTATTVPPNTTREDKVVKLTWWRPHGQTAIVPGLQRIILKVRVQAPGTVSQASTPVSPGVKMVDDIIGPDRMPHPVMMKHLLHVFMEHFGCQFPFLDQQALEASIDNRTGSTFLLVCIAAVAARFSSHPLIALKHLKPFEYGNNFHKVAKELLGSMLSVPSRETVIGLVLLGHMGLAIEEWMFTGMAVRMAIDLGLHLDPPEEAQISSSERRLNRLVFWSVVLLDFALAFGTGRQPTLRVEEITQLLPTDEDVPTTSVQNPFPFAARQMLAYGQLITVLNSGKQKIEEAEKAVILARSRAIQVYNTLPQDLHWNVTNLQRHASAGQAQMFLHIHLWMHTIIASGYLTDTDYLRRGAPRMTLNSGMNSGHVTPNAVAASNLWRNSARTIGDVLVLSDILNPNAYLALPFCNQAFFVAGCCYVKEIEQEQAAPPLGPEPSDASRPSGRAGNSMGSLNPDLKDGKKPSELFRSLLTSVATSNITTVQQGLTRQTTYWGGIAWVAEALAQRVAGIGASDIDLASITEKLSSSVYVADAGVLKAPSGENRGSNNAFNAISSLDESFSSLVGDNSGASIIGTADFSSDVTYITPSNNQISPLFG
ncbi:hypothetical protein IAU59_001689 [Kwoniella sp. CBS 9459]